MAQLHNNLFHKQATPINYLESIFKTCIVVLLALFVIWATFRLLIRIRYLEGLLPVCTFCKKIRVGDKWIPVEKYVSDHTEARFSHSFCPECAKKHYGDVQKRDSKGGTSHSYGSSRR